MKKQIFAVSLVLIILVGIVVTAFIVATRMKNDAPENNSETVFNSDELSNEEIYIEIMGDLSDFDEEEYVYEAPEDYFGDDDSTPSKDHEYPDYVPPVDLLNNSGNTDFEGPEDYFGDDDSTPSKDHDYPDEYIPPEIDEDSLKEMNK